MCTQPYIAVVGTCCSESAFVRFCLVKYWKRGDKSRRRQKRTSCPGDPDMQGIKWHNYPTHKLTGMFGACYWYSTAAHLSTDAKPIIRTNDPNAISAIATVSSPVNKQSLRAKGGGWLNLDGCLKSRYWNQSWPHDLQRAPARLWHPTLLIKTDTESRGAAWRDDSDM